MTVGLNIIKYHKKTNDKIFQQSLKSVEETQEVRGFLENKIKENYSLYEAQRAESHYYEQMLEQKNMEIKYLYAVQKNFLIKNDLIKNEEKKFTEKQQNNTEKDNSNDLNENNIEIQNPEKKPEKVHEVKTVHENLNQITTNFSD